jgi:hypothetical protein
MGIAEAKEILGKATITYRNRRVVHCSRGGFRGYWDVAVLEALLDESIAIAFDGHSLHLTFRDGSPGHIVDVA